MKYLELAQSLGADNAVVFQAEDIVYDPRVFLKCIFGCGSYGKNHTCPFQKSPLGIDEYRKILGHYQWGIIVGCSGRALSQHISYELERACFLDGYYFAFSMSDCGLCDPCTRCEGADCRFPDKARPSFHGVGIDVFKTVHKFGLPLAVAKTRDDKINWYSAVFVE